MSVSSLDPGDPKHATYITRKGDAEAEYLAQIKAALSQDVQHIIFADPFQIRREHKTLIHDITIDTICMGIKYSLKAAPMYF